MNKPNSKTLTSWILSAVFLVFVIGFSLIDQPNALAQSQTPSLPSESTSASVISPTASPAESVTANVRHLLETKECIGCNLSGAILKDANLQAANLEVLTYKMQTYKGQTYREQI
jgi:hypothetical protein